jgi:hypothetical protein
MIYGGILHIIYKMWQEKSCPQLRRQPKIKLLEAALVQLVVVLTALVTVMVLA